MTYIIIIVLGLILDRLTKTYAINNLIENPYNGTLFNFTYLENRGAAFGILQDRKIFFIILTLVIVCALVYYFLKNYRTNNKILNIALAMIISGAIGNFYDRLFQGYVVDFIEFAFVNFPVFNIADIFVTVGSILLIIYMIFFEESEKV
ncbi:signal peptidase II [Anaerococcus cruorum]|uniref:Lipoprotein signal peptidase n=1 Tax=Anaerococcus cruorum TaxID=3115617 RepID=A0ABW9MWK3_9FIRM